jgi:hypothetical protein
VHHACPEPFACERFKLGRRSPGPVQDSEYLNLVITDPQALDQRSGLALPLLLKRIDTSGVSVLRDAATSHEFEVTFAEMKRASDAQGKPRYFHGMCRFLAASVRRQNGARHDVGVYDTALPERPHHADILSPPANRRDLEARKKHLIYNIGLSFTPVAQVRNGAFIRYARDAVAGS